MMYKKAYINLYVSHKPFERKKKGEMAKECEVACGTNGEEINMKEPTVEGSGIYNLLLDNDSVDGTTTG